MANHDKILDNVPQMLLKRESWKAPYSVKIRPSSLPFCQVEYLFSLLDPIEASVGDSYMEKIFVSMGTAAHSVIQTYLGRANLLYGRWKCKKCYYISEPVLGTPFCGEKRLEWTRGTDLDENPIGPENGPCCKGYATKYEEFDLYDPESELKGHCDGLLIVAGRLYLFEAKTKATSSIVKALKAPDHTHICQGCTYAEMATPREWGLDQDVEGVAFCYIPRDYPNKLRFIFHPRDATTLENFRRELPEVLKMVEDGNVSGARAVCPNEKYARRVKFCEYAGTCFRPDRTKFLRKQWKLRQKEENGSDQQASIQESLG